MVCVPVPVAPFTVLRAVRVWAPAVVPVSEVEANPERVWGATGEKLPPGNENDTAVPSAAALPLTDTCACTVTGVCVVSTLPAAGAVIVTCTVLGGAGVSEPPLPPPQEATSAAMGSRLAGRRKEFKRRDMAWLKRRGVKKSYTTRVAAFHGLL